MTQGGDPVRFAMRPDFILGPVMGGLMVRTCSLSLRSTDVTIRKFVKHSSVQCMHFFTIRMQGVAANTALYL